MDSGTPRTGTRGGQANYPTHLSRAGGGRHRLTACGQRNPRNWTHDPAEVDCRACQRTLFMADAELRQQQKKSKRRDVL